MWNDIPVAWRSGYSFGQGRDRADALLHMEIQTLSESLADYHHFCMKTSGKTIVSINAQNRLQAYPHTLSQCEANVNVSIFCPMSINYEEDVELVINIVQFLCRSLWLLHLH